MVVGPFSPGVVIDQHLTLQLADIGVVLLMFGVGLHFKPRDLMEVKGTVVPGAMLQMAIDHRPGRGRQLSPLAGRWGRAWCSASACRWPPPWW